MHCQRQSLLKPQLASSRLGGSLPFTQRTCSVKAYESTPINHIMWTTFRMNCVNGWSIAHDTVNKQYLAVQSKALAIFKYEEENKLEKLQEANAFAARNTLASFADPETETHFFASEDLFIYRRQFCGSGIAFGAVAKTAAQKVQQQDVHWLRKLALSFGQHTTSLQLNENEAFLNAVSKAAAPC